MPVLRRATAWFIDFALMAAVATALAVFTFNRISALVTDVPALATRGGLDLLTSRGDVRASSAQFGLSLWSTTVLYVAQAFAALVVLTFLYHWVCLSRTGRTAGKALLGLTIAPVTSRQAARRAAVTATTDVAVFAVACVLLLYGHFLLSLIIWAVAVALFTLNALSVLTPTRRSLADRLAATAVVLSRPAPPDPGTPAAVPPQPAPAAS